MGSRHQVKKRSPISLVASMYQEIDPESPSAGKMRWRTDENGEICYKWEPDQANLDNSTQSIDVTGGKEGNVYKYRGVYRRDGHHGTITAKTINEQTQKSFDAGFEAGYAEAMGLTEDAPETHKQEQSGQTFGEWVAYLTEKGSVKEINDRHQGSSNLKNWILPYFGNKPLSTIKVSDCRAFSTHLAKTASSKTGKPIARKTAEHIITLLKQIFTLAVDDGIIPRNPAQKMDNRCAKGKKEHHAMTIDEQQRFFRALPKVKEENVRLYAELEILLGSRAQEIGAVRWEDLNLYAQQPYIDISRAVKWQNNPKGQWAVIKDTKTEAGNRKMPLIIPEIVEHLKQVRRDEGYVIRGTIKNKDGKKPITGGQKKTLDDKWNEYLTAEGLTRRITPLDCRHTLATMMWRLGIPEDTIKAWMGHTDIEITKEAYIDAPEWEDTLRNVARLSEHFAEMVVGNEIQ